MHDDDEERFPRITLLEFLGGILKPLAILWLWMEGWHSPFDSNEPKRGVGTMNLLSVGFVLALSTLGLIFMFGLDRQGATLTVLGALAIMLAFASLRAYGRTRSRTDTDGANSQ